MSTIFTESAGEITWKEEAFFDKTVNLATCINQGEVSSKILTLDTLNNIDFRTPAEIVSDGGGSPGFSLTQYRVPRLATASTLGISPIYTDAANTMVGIGGAPVSLELEVIDTTSAGLAAIQITAAANGVAGVYFGDGTWNIGALYYDHSLETMVLRTAGATTATLGATGTTLNVLSHETTPADIDGILVSVDGLLKTRTLSETLSDIGAQPVDADLTAIAGISVARGSIITGQGATPAWAELVLGANGTLVSSNGTDVAYQTLATLGIMPTTSISGTQNYLSKFGATGGTLGNSGLTDDATTIATTEIFECGGTAIQGSTANGYLAFRGDSGATLGMRLLDTGALVIGGTALSVASQAFEVQRNTNSYAAFSCINWNTTTDNYYPVVNIRKSKHNTQGSFGTTTSGMTIGAINFTGVGTNAAAWGAGIGLDVTQEGTAGAVYVPCALSIYSVTAAGAFNTFKFDSSGNFRLVGDSKRIYFGNDGDSSIMFNGTNTVFTADLTGGFTFTGGLLGVGGVPATAPLAVYGSGGENIRLFGRNYSGIDEAGLYFLKYDKSTFHGYIQGISSKLQIAGASTVQIELDGTTTKIGTPATNYSSFEADGTYVAVNNARVFDDIQFPISTAKVPAANNPNWETFTANTAEYAFDVDEYIDCQANEPPHGWDEGTTLDFHLHVTNKALQNAGADRFAKFSIVVSYCNAADSVWVEAAAITSEWTIANGTAALTGHYLDVGDIALSGYTVGTQIKARIKRIAATGGTEYSSSVFITQCGAHCIISRIGSRTETGA